MESRTAPDGARLFSGARAKAMDRKSRTYSEKSARERSYGAVPHSSAWVLTSLIARERAGDFIFNDATLNQVPQRIGPKVASGVCLKWTSDERRESNTRHADH